MSVSTVVIGRAIVVGVIVASVAVRVWMKRVDDKSKINVIGERPRKDNTKTTSSPKDTAELTVVGASAVAVGSSGGSPGVALAVGSGRLWHGVEREVFEKEMRVQSKWIDQRESLKAWILCHLDRTNLSKDSCERSFEP